MAKAIRIKRKGGGKKGKVGKRERGATIVSL